MSNKKIFLNGPLNYVKLYNKQTNQILWLFLDIHLDIREQMKCSNYESKDIDKYFYKIFTETTETLDFLFEITPTNIKKEYQQYYTNEKYIIEISKIFKKIYKEQQEKQHKNIRLHYIDIRDYTYFNTICDICSNLKNNIYQNGLFDISYIISELQFIVEKLKHINSVIDNIVNTNTDDYEHIIKNKLDIISIDVTEEVQIQSLYRLMHKILKHYSNKIDRKNITEYFYKKYYEKSNNIIEYIEQMLVELQDIQTVMNNTKDKKLYISEKTLTNKLNVKSISYGIYYNTHYYKYTEWRNNVYDKISILYHILTDTGCVFMDCYFLRRIIEKENYIKKAIIYTGGYHSIEYIWFLIKYYNFVIDECYYMNKNRLNNNNLIDIIKNTTDCRDLYEIFFPENLNQCIEITPI